ncbi:hypothetical protein EEW87_17680 (plasmid) [Janibacter melonis]|uniref:THIF-type NAD/FAD binding fold domain-containing protein n=1 Tax=Janibacter melonis TaxID=262209 RepID=A0A650GEZ6_9MICO|nr:ThiF family adenylyltransferase [Janibacter melonis]QGX08836.1 hypothetical protein EEW87_17680 [Janibacter melonis]
MSDLIVPPAHERGADYSRTLRLAAANAAHDEIALKSRLEGSVVRVSADPTAPAALITLQVLVANLRRLPVQLHLDPRGGDKEIPSRWLSDLEQLAAGIDPERPLVVTSRVGDGVHVHVGTSSTTALASGVADGHGTRIRPRGTGFSTLAAAGTGLGGVLTASLLTAEVFKVVVGVLPNRRGDLRPIDFCPVTLDAPQREVALLGTLHDTTLVGCGAIGTAIALILRELTADGTLTVVDPQIFETPNVTTYSLGDLDDAASQVRKVDLIERELRTMDVSPHEGFARDYIDAIENGQFTMPQIVLGALDSIEARHDIAAIHAQHVLDGSTGGPAGTMLSLSEATWAGPCLRCYFPARTSEAPTTDELLAQRTGLSLARISRGQDPLTPQELDELGQLSEKDRAILETQVGKAVCGLGKALGLVGQADDFNPSAAFVAQQAAALVVGSLIRGGLGAQARSVQYDALFGPRDEMTMARSPQPDCRCQTQRSLHEQVRSYRGAQ